MGIYIIAPCFLENISEKKYITEVLLPFTQENTLAVGVDHENIIYDIYALLAEKRPELASWLSLMSYEPSSFVRITKIDSAIVEIVEKFLFVCKCVFTLYPNVRSIHRVLFLSVQITRLYCRQF